MLKKHMVFSTHDCHHFNAALGNFFIDEYTEIEKKIFNEISLWNKFLEFPTLYENYNIPTLHISFHFKHLFHKSLLNI